MIYLDKEKEYKELFLGREMEKAFYASKQASKQDRKIERKKEVEEYVKGIHKPNFLGYGQILLIWEAVGTMKVCEDFHGIPSPNL